VLLPVAGPLAQVQAELGPRVTPELVDEVLSRVPDEWLAPEPGLETPQDVRSAYAEVLLARAAAPGPWLDAVEVTRAAAV
jgi:hypothetical protein